MGDALTRKVIIFGENKIVWGSEQGEHILSKGTYEFEFSFDSLKSSLPASFEHEFGHIRYSIEANLSRPWGHDGNAEVLVSVVPTVQSLTNQTQQKPKASQYRKKGCNCCFSRSIELGLILTNESSLVNFPGSKCVVRVNIYNKTNKIVKKASLEFEEVTRFISSNGHKKETKRTISTFVVPCPVMSYENETVAIDISSVFDSTLLSITGTACTREYVLRLVSENKESTELVIYCLPEN
eukprot:c27467_g1_i1.p1 GENE.c27467_g1_i1~~c27467_g1_i1.p1  ORF type:complete len:239 (-),score=70.64 c27467_g1_i1:48-764(-)